MEIEVQDESVDSDGLKNTAGVIAILSEEGINSIEILHEQVDKSILVQQESSFTFEEIQKQFSKNAIKNLLYPTQNNSEICSFNNKTPHNQAAEFNLNLCTTQSTCDLTSPCTVKPLKQTQYKPLLQRFQIYPRYSFHIYGDIMVHTDINSMGEFVRTCSPINLEKRITQILFSKQRKFVEISFEETNTKFLEFDNFIHIFSEYPDQTLHRFGRNLMKYKTYAMKQMKMTEICKKQENYQQFCQLKSVKYHRFKKATEQLFNDSEGKYMCFFYFKRNYQTGGVELEQMGINENLINLLGSTAYDYEEMARRIGVYSFQSRYSYNFLFNQYLETMGRMMTKSGCQNIHPGIFKAGAIKYASQMLTFDDYILETTNNVETYLDFTDEDSDLYHNLLKFRDILHVYTLEISESTLSMVNDFRKNSQTSLRKQDEMVRKSSLQYELEASVFLEKFYGKKKQSQKEKQDQEQCLQMEKQKICGYKILTASTTL